LKNIIILLFIIILLLFTHTGRMAAASPENFPQPELEDLAYDGYSELLLAILRALGIGIDEHQTIFDEMAVVIEFLEQS
jgi:hypothetical protein